MCKSLSQRRLSRGRVGTNLASLSLKFCDRSAARDAPGEEPRTDLLLKYSGLGSWKVNWPLPSGLGTRCGPKRLDWPKLEGGAGRIAASGEEVSMTLQDVGACTNAVVLLYGSGVCRRCRPTVSTAGCSACSTEGEVACFEGREGRSSGGSSALHARASRVSWRSGWRQLATTTSVAPVERCSGARAERLLGPNLTFLSSSGATRAVCGFGAGRTREGGSL
jgi:hypothetical protein